MLDLAPQLSRAVQAEGQNAPPPGLVAVRNDLRPGVALAGSWSSAARLTVPTLEPELRFVHGLAQAVPSRCGARIRWRLDLVSAGDQAVALWERDAGAGAVDWAPVSRSLAPWAGQQVDLRLRVEADLPQDAPQECLPTAALGEPRVVAGQGPPGAPDLWVVLIDTLRADRVLGQERAVRTPALDGLRERGLHFERCWSTASWTREAVFSMLSGVQPAALERADSAYAGVVAQKRLLAGAELRLPAGVPTVVEALRAAGYRSLGRYNNPTVPPGSGVERGFDSYWLLGSDADVVQRLPQGLAASDPRRPRLVWVHLLGAHLPYERWPGLTERHLQAAGLQQPWPEQLRDSDLPREQAPVELRSLASAYYDGEVERADALLGELLAALEASGRAERSWLFVLSDHGEELWDHGGFEHGHSLYQELLHVPLLVVPPAGWQGRTGPQDLPVSLADLAATLAELGGAEGAWGPWSWVAGMAEGSWSPGWSERTLAASGTLYGPRRRALLQGERKLSPRGGWRSTIWGRTRGSGGAWRKWWISRRAGRTRCRPWISKSGMRSGSRFRGWMKRCCGGGWRCWDTWSSAEG